MYIIEDVVGFRFLHANGYCNEGKSILKSALILKNKLRLNLRFGLRFKTNFPRNKTKESRLCV